MTTNTQHSTFHDLLDARASEGVNDRAFTFLPEEEGPEQRLTYGELRRRAVSIAIAIHPADSSPQRALLLFPPGLDFIAAMFACLCNRVTAIPAYPPRPSSERSFERLIGILTNADPTLILTTSRLLPHTQKLLSRTPSAHPPRILLIDQLNSAAANQASPWPNPPVSSEEIACLQYTSGSTSTPRGVILTHANLRHNAHLIKDALGLGRHSRGVLWLPPYHDMGLGGLLQAIYSAFPLTIMSPASFLQSPIRWLREISRSRATMSGGPNFAYDLCASTVTDEDKRSLDLTSWELAFNGAEPIDPATLDRFANAFASCGFRRTAFYPCYGLAEATLLVASGTRGIGIITAPAPDADHSIAANPFVACGSPRPGLDLRIVNPTDNRPLPANAIGEIWLRGQTIAKGYWNPPDPSDNPFNAQLHSPAFPRVGSAPRTIPPANPDQEIAQSPLHPTPPPPADDSNLSFLRTGDLGFLRDGNLFITGRLKDLIIIRGVNHYPQDIERTARQSHPALNDAMGAAFSINNDAQERLVIVHEIQRAHRNDDPAPIVAAIRQAIAENHALDLHALALLRPGQLPKTSSGKVQRRLCRDNFLSGGLQSLFQWQAPSVSSHPRPLSQSPLPSAPAEPQSAAALESWIITQLAASVGCPAGELDPAEPFARYGLDSVKAASLASELSKRIARPLPMTIFWDYPSTRLLAAHLSHPEAS